jgi:type I restriction enzyme S subunit
MQEGIRPGYKQTEVGVIPEDWKAGTLGSLVQITTGKKDVNEGNPSGNFPFFTCSRNHTYSDSYSFDCEAILVAGNGDVGNLSYHFGKFEAYQRTYVLSNFDADVGFVWQTLKRGLAEALGLGKIGSSIPYIKKENLTEFSIALPPLSEQRAIAAALADADALIAALEGMIAKKRDLKQAAMQHLLTGKTRLSGFSGEWRVFRQQEVITLLNGRAYGRHEWETSGTPVCRLQNLTGSGENFYFSKLVLPERQYMVEGDLIYMWSASFGPHIWSGPKAIFHYHIWKVECDPERVDRQFYYYKLVELTETLKATMGGSTMLHLTKTGMEKFLVNLPPVAEQTAIAEVLSDIDADLAALEAQAAKARAVKQGMMQELLTGRVRLV